MKNGINWEGINFRVSFHKYSKNWAEIVAFAFYLFWPKDKKEQEILGRANSPTFPTCHLFEVLEPNLMKINLSELTLTSLNSI
jgi:hypothetical protein